ncbi:GNAT family N-acetyltransferase [candidate division KSB1 bacterium]|nr:GNAT family N-acetyltransferase [candidate division KSB1 bacterium]
MKLTRLQKTDEISDCRQYWDQIWSQQESTTINDDFDWILLLYKHFGHIRDNAFYVLRDQNSVLALLPLIQRRLYCRKIIPYKQLTHIGTISGVTDFCSLYRHPDTSGLTPALKKVFKPYQQIQLKFILPSVLNKLSENLLALSHYKIKILQCTKNLYIDLNTNRDWQAYFYQLSKNTRRELTKRFNKLEKTQWHISNNGIHKTSDLVDIIKSIHTRRQHHLNRQSLFEDKKFISYFIDLIDCFGRKNALDYSLLYIREKPVSFTLGFKHQQVYYHWLIGFDPKYETFSPNKLHHMYLIQRMMKENMAQFNFMRGDSPYKFKWTKTFQPLYEIKLWNRSTLYKRIFTYVKTIRTDATSHFGNHTNV